MITYNIRVKKMIHIFKDLETIDQFLDSLDSNFILDKLRQFREGDTVVLVCKVYRHEYKIHKDLEDFYLVYEKSSFVTTDKSRLLNNFLHQVMIGTYKIITQTKDSRFRYFFFKVREN